MDNDKKAKKIIDEIIKGFGLPNDLESFAADSMGLGREFLLEFLNACKRSPILAKLAEKERAFEIIYACNAYIQHNANSTRRANKPVNLLISLLKESNRDEPIDGVMTYRKWSKGQVQVKAAQTHNDSQQATADETRAEAVTFLARKFDKRLEMLEAACEFYADRNTPIQALEIFRNEHITALKMAEQTGGKPKIYGRHQVRSQGIYASQDEFAAQLAERYLQGKFLPDVPSMAPRAGDMRVLNVDNLRTKKPWSEWGKAYRERMQEDGNWPAWSEEVYQQAKGK